MGAKKAVSYSVGGQRKERQKRKSKVKQDREKEKGEIKNKQACFLPLRSST